MSLKGEHDNMRANLILNEHNKIAFIYGENLGFTPQWASIDVERGEIFIANNDGTENGKQIKLDDIKQEIYERIASDTEILLVRVENNDITKPVDATWVALMIAQQM